jgi:hypothetical protein
MQAQALIDSLANSLVIGSQSGTVASQRLNGRDVVLPPLLRTVAKKSEGANKKEAKGPTKNQKRSRNSSRN